MALTGLANRRGRWPGARERAGEELTVKTGFSSVYNGIHTRQTPQVKEDRALRVHFRREHLVAMGGR
jgi:hypothetical protein